MSTLSSKFHICSQFLSPDDWIKLLSSEEPVWSCWKCICAISWLSFVCSVRSSWRYDVPLLVQQQGHLLRFSLSPHHMVTIVASNCSYIYQCNWMQINARKSCKKHKKTQQSNKQCNRSSKSARIRSWISLHPRCVLVDEDATDEDAMNSLVWHDPWMIYKAL